METYQVQLQRREDGTPYLTFKQRGSDEEREGNFVGGYFHSISFKEIKTKNADFPLIAWTNVDIEENHACFCSMPIGYVANDFINMLLGATEDQMNTVFKLWFSVSKTRGADGKYTEPVLNKKGKKIPRLAMLANAYAEKEDQQWLRPTFWVDDNTDNKCEHELADKFKECRNMAIKGKTNAPMAVFFEEALEKYLVEELGWEKKVYENPNSFTKREIRFINPLVDSLLKEKELSDDRPTRKDVDFTDSVEDEVHVADIIESNGAADDDLPF